ncbi:MAG: aspartyl protease family protein [Nanoarchaeota archaeon]|nr:aspartyl protease family protein [Nanoarchaeota archaeon]
MVLSFRYHVIPDVTNGEKKPTIPVEFKLESGGYIEVMCLVDSGSDVVVLPKGIAELLNLNLGEESNSLGIGGEVPVRLSRASFRIKKEHGYHTLTVPVEVFNTDNIPVLLGRQGFFDKFKVTIDERDKKVILKEHSSRISSR